MARRHRCWIVLALLLTGCSSIPWRDGAPAETWHGASLHLGDLAVVAARDESAAADVYSGYEAVRDALQVAGVVVPSAPLLLAVGPADALLCGDPMATVRKLVEWHQACLGATTSPAHDSTAPVPADVPARLLASLARALASAAPIDASELALPPSWRQTATWCVVVPTTASTDALADALLDHGLETEGLSFGERLLLAPVLPFLRGKVRGHLHGEVLRRVLEAALAVVGRERSLPPDAMATATRQLGLDQETTAPAFDG